MEKVKNTHKRGGGLETGPNPSSLIQIELSEKRKTFKGLTNNFIALVFEIFFSSLKKAFSFRFSIFIFRNKVRMLTGFVDKIIVTKIPNFFL